MEIQIPKVQIVKVKEERRKRGKVVPWEHT